jgi:hypothetical protein
MSSRSKILMAMFFALDLSLKHDSLCQLGPSPISPHGPAIGKATFQMMGVFARAQHDRAGACWHRPSKASGTKRGKAFGRARLPAETEERIRDALATPGEATIS